MLTLIVALMGLAAAETVQQAFVPPAGAVRADADAFGRWLRNRPLRAADQPVRTHAGAVVAHPARVVDMPLVPGDLQQCADSAIRLRAEWLREVGRSPMFHSTSGDPLPWSRFSSGEAPFVQNGHIAWRATDPSRQSWDRWLVAVFRWAGTRSLFAYDSVPADEPRPGDLLVQPGSPGHAVVVLDVAMQGDEVWLLVGEGFMPAQDFHVELGPDSGWWPWTADGLNLPHWPLPQSALRRWRQ